MNALGVVLRSLGEANGRLWRRSKILWFVGLILVLCICCAGVGSLATLMPGYKESATATAQAKREQTTAEAIKTENASILAAQTAEPTTAETNTPLALATASFSAAQNSLTEATATPQQVPTPTEGPATAEPLSPTLTPTTFFVVVTSVPTETRVAPTNTRAPIPATKVPTQASEPSAQGEVVIVGINYRGTPPNQTDEYAEIRNDSASAVDLSGWRLNAGSEGQDFRFPSGFALDAGKTCRIYTNENHSEWCGFSFQNGNPLWNNDGDCGHLYDEQGVEVSKWCY